MVHRSTALDTTLRLMFQMDETYKHAEIVPLIFTLTVPWASLGPRQLFAVSWTSF